MPNVSKEHCAARNNYRQAIDLCFESVDNLRDLEVAKELYNQAVVALIELGERDSMNIAQRHEWFMQDLRTATRLAHPNL